MSSGSVSTSRPSPPGNSTRKTCSNSRAVSWYALANTSRIRSSTSLTTVSRSRRVALRSSSCSERNLYRSSSAANSSSASGFTLPSRVSSRSARAARFSWIGAVVRHRLRSARRPPPRPRIPARSAAPSDVRPVLVEQRGRRPARNPRRPWLPAARPAAAARRGPPRRGAPRRSAAPGRRRGARRVPRTSASSASRVDRASAIWSRCSAAAASVTAIRCRAAPAPAATIRAIAAPRARAARRAAARSPGGAFGGRLPGQPVGATGQRADPLLGGTDREPYLHLVLPGAWYQRGQPVALLAGRIGVQRRRLGQPQPLLQFGRGRRGSPRGPPRPSRRAVPSRSASARAERAAAPSSASLRAAALRALSASLRAASAAATRVLARGELVLRGGQLGAQLAPG